MIDIVIFSSDLNKHLLSVHIDEERKHVLSRIYKTKKGTKIKESDHNTITTEFNIKVTPAMKSEKIEFYNLKNKDCLAKFKSYTSESNMLSSIFDSNDDIDALTKRLVKKINGCIAMNFSKRRMGTKEDTTNNNDLFSRMSSLKGKNDDESKAELKEVTDTLAERGEQNFNKLKEELAKLKSKCGLDAKQLWKLKKRLCPKTRDPPTAMLDKYDNLLTSDSAIQNRALEVFTERLDNNKISPALKDLENDTNELCKMRLKASKKNRSDPWTISDLEEALKQLDNNKSRDAEGFANELFKNAGSDLLGAVLKLMNLIKYTQQYPKIMEKCNITAIHKKKSKKDFQNYRGVFRVQILRSILDRLTYNDCYYTIDNYLTDGNVGARKHRSVRDNIFVLSAITNSVTNGNSPPIQVQVMDQKTCFDKLWLEECINSLYEAGINDDKLNLLYIENRNVQVAVKVNNKLSKRVNVNNVVMQGSVWSSLKCTTNMDKLNKIALSDESLQYNYKGDSDIPVGMLGMVDDTLGVSNCGSDAIKKNAVINSFVETQRQELSLEKSVVVHIGSDRKCTAPCPKLQVHSEPMATSECTKYLGHFVSSKGGIYDTVEDRRKKGWGKIAQIMGILEEVDMGSNRLEAGLLLRQSILVNSLLFSAEAWSALTDRHLARMEVVDNTLLSRLTGGQSKCPSEFNYLETGSLKLRHILTYRRLLYHHEILSRGEDETIRKIYMKQKVDRVKGDWIELLEHDFDFIGINMNEEEIQGIPKREYKLKIRGLVRKAALKYFLELKLTHRKLDLVQYDRLQIQPYLINSKLSNEEKSLLYCLRSHCHKSKINFKKMHRNSTFCSLGCSAIEDQQHIFTQCKPQLRKIKNSSNLSYNNIFGSLQEQIEVTPKLYQIELTRLHMKEHLVPGGRCRQDPCIEA